MSFQGLKFVTLDVFTEQKFKGNPLAIVHVPEDKKLSQEEKQSIATEFNLSETVFLHEGQDKPGQWVIDIFTKEKELPFAGHPTIGSACYLGGNFPDLDRAVLVTKAGPIPITFQRQPTTVTGLPEASASVPQTLHVHNQRVTREELLKMQPNLANQDKLPESFPVASITKGMNFGLYELGSAETLNSVGASNGVSERDFITLDQGWPPTQFSAYFFVVDHAASTAQKLQVSARMIETWGEDPATGSAACDLAGYLTLEHKRKGLIKGQSLQVEITQGKKMGRESKIGVEVQLGSDNNVSTIVLTGKTIPVTSGQLV